MTAEDRTPQNHEYVALIRKEDGTGYCIDMPDMPGCISAASTKEEAIDQFHEALALHLEGMKEDRQPLPTPRSLSEIAAQEQDSYIEAFMIEVSA